MNPPFPRRHLLCIAGLTPQVLTETLYALAREGTASLPTDIHVLSTEEGIARARLTLLSEQPGWFHRLCDDYQLPAMHFDQNSLQVLTRASGEPLTDIRDGEDNTAAADAVTEWIRRLTADDDAQVHVSLAGGRKTLGFFAGYALSLFGRPQDRLTHVLVNAPFESHPNFFYPTPYPEVIYGLPPDSRPLDSRDAIVTLADIPFVRLRHGLPDGLLKGRASFSATVGMAQRSLGPPRLEIDLARRRLMAGGISVELPRRNSPFTSGWPVACWRVCPPSLALPRAPRTWGMPENSSTPTAPWSASWAQRTVSPGGLPTVWTRIISNAARAASTAVCARP